MSIEQKRHELMKLYGSAWQAKAAVMPDNQVHTVYMRLLNKGVIKPTKEKTDGNRKYS